MKKFNNTSLSFVLLFSFSFLTNTLQSQIPNCIFSNLILDDVVDLNNGTYQIDLIFCAGGGSDDWDHCGGQNDTYDFGFILFGADFVSFPATLTSQQTNAEYQGALWPGTTDSLVYATLLYEPWVCNINCGPIGPYCSTVTFITNGLPDSIFCLGMEGGGYAPFGCLGENMWVYPNDPNDPCGQYNWTASTGDDVTVYQGYAPEACTYLNTTITNYGPSPFTFEWSDGSTTPTIYVCPTSTTTYSLTVTDVNGCTSTNEVTVTVEDVRCGRRNNKVLMCKPNGVTTRCVSQNKVAGKLNNGWTLGACSGNNNYSATNGYTLDWANDYESSIRLNSNILDAQTQLEIIAEENGKVEINLYDINGRIVKNIFSGNMEEEEYLNFEIESSELARGIYLLHVRSDFDWNESFKMVK